MVEKICILWPIFSDMKMFIFGLAFVLYELEQVMVPFCP